MKVVVYYAKSVEALKQGTFYRAGVCRGSIARFINGDYIGDARMIALATGLGIEDGLKRFEKEEAEAIIPTVCGGKR